MAEEKGRPAEGTSFFARTLTSPLRHGRVKKKGAGDMRVWTRQHRSVLEEISVRGRYAARRSGVYADLQEQAPLVLTVYDWLAEHHPLRAQRPVDAEGLVWLSYERSAAMLTDAQSVLLELEISEERIAPVNIAKWGAILNYAYLPRDEADALRHRREMDAQGLSDAQVCMSRFYPALRQEIVQSWDRLFDPAVSLGNGLCYGTTWELRKEWLIEAK